MGKSGKKRLHFQFGVRKRLKTDMIIVGSMLAVTLIMTPFAGVMNAMASSMGVIIVFISTWYDYTDALFQNVGILTAGAVGVILAAFLAYSAFPQGTAGYAVMMTAVTFVTFFLIIYIFTSETKGNFFMPMLLSFSAMLYSPAYGWELLIRIAVALFFMAVVVLFQILLYRGKFQEKVRMNLKDLIEQIEDLCLALLNREALADLENRYQGIEKKITELNQIIAPRLAQHEEWQYGHDRMRTVHILHRIVRTLHDNHIEGPEEMEQELYERLHGLLVSIELFEEGKIPESDLIREFDRLFGCLHGELSGKSVAQELLAESEDFLDEEVRHSDKQEQKKTLWERMSSRISLYTAVFGLKTASVAALGVLITCLFQFENANMYVMTIAVLAQPYVEVSSKKIRLRILNTLFALAIFFIAFSIPGNLWIHLAVLLAIILVADMFMQFETNVIASTMIAVISRVASDPNQMLSISLYRLIYVAAAGILLMLVDVLIFPNRLLHSLEKQIRASLDENRDLRAILFSGNCTAQELKTAVMRKRLSNQKVKHVNQFVQNAAVSEYLFRDEIWLNQMTMIMHRLRVSGLSPEAMQDLVLFAAHPDTGDEYVTLRQRSLLYSTRDVLVCMAEAQEQGERILAGKAEPVPEKAEEH